MGAAIEAFVGIVGLVFGLGAAGVGIAWLNDRRLAAVARKKPLITPRETLEARFAAGEIDDAEFNRCLNRLLIGPTLELD